MSMQQGANPLLPLMFPAAIVLIWYILVFKPQGDKQKEHKKAIAGLKKNDEIVTAGGIHAKVVNVKDKTIVIRIDDNVKVEVDKEAITTVSKSTS